jgi:hypothetical protein
VTAPAAGHLGATRDLVEDRLAVLAAWVLVGHDDDARPLAGDAAHLRALGGVALAGRPEDRDQSAATSRCRRREEVEHRRQRRGAVGEIDHHAEGLAEVDPFHAPRDDVDARQSLADTHGLEAERLAERDHRERVVDVEATRQVEIDRRVARGRGHVGVEPACVLGDARRPDVGRRLGAVGEDARPGAAGRPDEQPGRWVVEVDDGGGHDGGRLLDAAHEARSIEQRQLRVAIRLPGPVQLEMLVGDVGEDRDVVGDARDPVQGEPVGRRLDDRGLVAGVDHRPESGLQLGRFGGRRVLGVVVGATADPRGDRADHPSAQAGRLERRHGEVARGRLPVRARDADDRQRVGWVAEPPRRRARECRTCRVDDDLRRGHPGHGLLDDDPRRAALDRRRDEVVPVDPEPRHGDEQHPW